MQPLYFPPSGVTEVLMSISKVIKKILKTVTETGFTRLFSYKFRSGAQPRYIFRENHVVIH